MRLKKAFGEELGNTITSDDIVGKDVIDIDGEFIGVVEMLHIDPSAVEVIGITIDKGFLRKGLIIGKDYIERVAPHAIFLKIRPSYKLKGMNVFDSEGENIGIVTKVNLHGKKNEVESIIVRSGIFKRDVVIPVKFIRNIGYNVLLSVKKDDIMKLNKYAS
ncbi:PRC-barrel domain-containing protein [Candidatus Pacearchaeota archaeon]|nr:PRC-barrel domain-containing protein [Candidatus Pacearchaeota archaeon]